MASDDTINIDLEIPFSTPREAEIAYHVLRVEKEPKRSGVTKELTTKGNILVAKFSGNLMKQVRVAANCFFDNVLLILETIQFTGPPVSDNYSHF